MLFGEGHGKLLRGVITNTLPFLPCAVVDTIMATLRNQLVITDLDDQKESANDVEIMTPPLGRCDDAGDIRQQPASPSLAAHPHLHLNLHLHPLHTYINTTMRLEETLVERMNLLTPTEFERILHPIFEEDEFTLILAGTLQYITPDMCFADKGDNCHCYSSNNCRFKHD